MTAADPFTGKILQQRYQVLERLAEGAMGVVYKGVRLTLQRPVAIKFLHPAVALQPNLRKRFEVEARAMGALSHPNCVSVIDFGVEDVPYVVMDFVSGRSLRDTMENGALSRDRALSVARQILTALVHAHAQGIVHRDIKPENMILQQSAGLEDHVRVLDFGMARIVNATEGLTVGMVLGTPNYMAPEQAQESEIDGRADLYSTAIVLFEMLTGRQPFAADSVGDVLRRQLTEPAPRLREAAPGGRFSAALEGVLLKAMAKPPGDRFPTAQAMLDALEQVPELQGKASVASVLATEPTALARGLPLPPARGKAPPVPVVYGSPASQDGGIPVHSAPADPTQWDAGLAERVLLEAKDAKPARHHSTMVLTEFDEVDNSSGGRQPGWTAVATLITSKAKGLWLLVAAFVGTSPPRWKYGVAGMMLAATLLTFFATRGGSPNKANSQQPAALAKPGGVDERGVRADPSADTKQQGANKPDQTQRMATQTNQDREQAKVQAGGGSSPTRPRFERRPTPIKKASPSERWGTRWKK